MYRFLLTLLLFTLYQNAFSQRCVSQQLLQNQIGNNQILSSYRADLEEDIQKWVYQNRHNSFREVITIDVVVHVVWQQPSENISDEQIFSQIAVLNEDFRLLNTNADMITHPPFVAVMADMELVFQLATTDPSGNISDGISRKQTPQPNIGSSNNLFYSDQGGDDAWCPAHYLNIWVAKIGSGILAASSFPEDGTPLEEEGIRINPTVFGRTGTVEAPYHLGRTLTHEIGHYFNLFHLWGSGEDNFDCQGDDEVEDTPTQSRSYKETCYQNIHTSCGSADMTANFLNYTDDACMAMFTHGQKMRALATLHVARSGLLSSSACFTPVHEIKNINFNAQIFPVPTHDGLNIHIESNSNTTFTFQLIDLNGLPIHKQDGLKVGNNSVSLGNFKNGFYLVKLSDGMQIINKKIILLR